MAVSEPRFLARGPKSGASPVPSVVRMDGRCGGNEARCGARVPSGVLFAELPGWCWDPENCHALILGAGSMGTFQGLDDASNPVAQFVNESDDEVSLEPCQRPAPPLGRGCLIS